MENYFAQIVFGHLIGDYLLQSKKMTLTKSNPGFNGIKACTIHCLIYTISVCIMIWNINPIIVGLVFLSHWPLDRWSLGSHWLKLIKGRSLIDAYNSKDQFREFDIAFSSIVYTVVDNTFHLLLLWGIGIFFIQV